MSSLRLNRHWRVLPMLLCHLLAIPLFLSWLWPESRAIWDQFDLQLFHLLNAPIEGKGLWAYIWAFGSLRPVDIGVGLVMLAVMLKGEFIFAANEVRKALFAFLGVLIVMLLIRVLFSKWIDHMDWQHDSPSMVVEGAIRLTELFPSWEARFELKDRSSNSFPGDHASVLLIWAMFMSLFSRGWKTTLVWLLAAIFMLPRLVAGAHWGSDDFVGGVLLGLLALAWGSFTPWAYHFSNVLERLSAPLWRHLAQWPLLGQLSVIRAAPQLS